VAILTLKVMQRAIVFVGFKIKI